MNYCKYLINPTPDVVYTANIMNDQDVRYIDYHNIFEDNKIPPLECGGIVFIDGLFS